MNRLPTAERADGPARPSLERAGGWLASRGDVKMMGRDRGHLLSPRLRR